MDNRYKMPRLTDALCVEYLHKAFGADCNIVHVREYSAYIKHACRYAGISQMSLNTHSITLCGRQVFVAYCNVCKKVWYYVPEVL